MQTETVPVDSLALDPENLRIHPEENLQAIGASLQRFGQVLPLVVHDGVVVGGNGTLRALKRIGRTDAVIVRFAGERDEAKALAVALNRSAELASWDEAALGEALAGLQDEGFSPESLGFSDSDLESLFPAMSFDPAPEPGEPSEAAEPRTLPLVKHVLIFETEDQQGQFFGFLKWLKKEYPDAETSAGRLAAHISAAMGA